MGQKTRFSIYMLMFIGGFQDLLAETMPCFGDPPEMENGKAVIIDKRHLGQYVTYICDEGSTISKIGNVRCFNGTWTGKPPKCDFQGDIHIPTTTVKPRLPSPTTISLRSVTTSRGSYAPSEIASTKEFSLSTTPSRVSTFLATEEITTPAVTDPTENLEDQCSCYYSLDDSSVVAHANGKRLSLGDKVQSGVKIIFRCLHFGYHHLNGRTEITCADCQPWHSSDFPTCTEPKKGNFVVTFAGNVTVLEDGALLINKGQNVDFSCIAVETAEYPRWNVPHGERISFKSKKVRKIPSKGELRGRKEYYDVLYQTNFKIQNADYSHAGTYSCFLKNNEKTTFNVTVIDPDLRCPEFPNDSSDLIITYEKDRQENSKAYFSCPNKDQELVGEPVSTCLRTKEWSAPLPFCAGSCSVPQVENGEMSKFSVRQISSWRKEEIYKPLSEGERVDHDIALSFRCNEGFGIGEGNKILEDVRTSVTCYDGKWSRDLHCKDTSCRGDPPKTENGKAMVSRRTHGHMIWYKCDNPRNWKIRGNVTCYFGSWIGIPPQCLSLTPCFSDDLVFPGLVKPSKKVVASSEIFDIACKEGYRLSTSAKTMTCKSGKWNVTEDPCPLAHRVIVCPFFPAVRDRTVSYSNDNQVGSRATFSCPTHATLVGSATSDCRRDGTWSSPGPNCLNKTTCALFRRVSGLRIEYSNENFPGSNATFTCSFDKVLNGHSSSVCLENGNWSHQIPSCEDKCSVGILSTSVKEGVVPDMSAIRDEYVPFGTTVPLICDGKYIPVGNSTAVCGEQGRWKIGKFECASGCRLNIEPSSRLQVQPLKDSYRFGENVVLKCPWGEKTTNDVERLICLGELWSEDIPSCIKS